MATLEGKWTFNDTLTGTIDATLNFTFTDVSGVEHTANNIFFDGNQATFRTSDNLYLVYSNGKWANKVYQKIRVADGQENATVLAWFETNAIEDKYETLHRGIAARIDILQTIKADIKEALAEKGADLSNDFTTYADKIRNLASAKPVKNINLDEDGVLTWDAPEIFDLTDAEVIGYVVDVNGTTFETTETSVDVSTNLITGENTITVVAVISFKNEGKTVVAKYPKQLIITLSTTTLEAKVCGTSACEYEGKIYVIGGYTGTQDYSTIRCYNPQDNSITNIGSTSGYSSYGVASVATNNKIYYFGGEKRASSNDKNANVYCFDLEAKTNTLLANFTFTSNKFKFTTAQLINNKVYLIGGTWQYENRSSHIFEYDIESNTAKIGAELILPTTMKAPQSIEVDGKIYIHYNNKFYLFDPVTYSVTTLSATAPLTQQYASAVNINGKMYVFGGYISNSEYLDSIVKYNPKTNTATLEESTLVTKMAETSAVAIGNKAYIFGGLDYTNYNWKSYNYIQIAELE